MGSRRWPGSIPRAARPAAPGSPPPPSGSPGGAQGRLGQGLPRGSAASALMNTSRGASALRGLCPKDGTAALSPYPHLHAFPHRCAHLEGNPQALTCSKSQPATVLQGWDLERVLTSPGGSLCRRFQVLVRPPTLRVSPPPRGGHPGGLPPDHVSHRKNLEQSDPVQQKPHT